MIGADTHMILRDPAKLRRSMDRAGISVRMLAEICTEDFATPISRAMVGHLLSGYSYATAIERAQAIEDALQVPAGALFRPVPSPRKVPAK